MANRQIPTTLFDDSWFYELSNDAKLLFFHIYLKSDHAGIIDIIPRRIEFDLSIDFEKTFKDVEPFLHQISGMKYIMPLVLFTQFPNGLESNHKFQGSVLKSLTNNGLDYDELRQNKGLPKACQSLSKALPKAYSNSHSISNSQSNDNSNSKKGELQKNSSLPAVTKKRKSKYLSHDEFMERMEAECKKQVKIGNGFVYLRPVKEFGETMVREMILQLDLYKSQNEHYCGKELYVSDERVLRKSWVLRNAQQALSAKNSPVIQDIRKRERIADEIRNNTEFFNPEPQE
jgi:hypothetical protein